MNRDEKKRLGICVDCRKPAISGQVRCEDHARYCRARRVERKENQTHCQECGTPIDNGPGRCDSCRSAAKINAEIPDDVRRQLGAIPRPPPLRRHYD